MTDTTGYNPLFSAEVIAAIDQAFDKACAVIRTEGYGDEFRFQVAEQIFQLAQRGESDMHRLCVGSVSRVLEQRPA